MRRPLTRRQLFMLAATGGLFGGVMGEQLVPDSHARTIADLDRRIRALETSQRVGLHRARMMWWSPVNLTAPQIGTPVDSPESITIEVNTRLLIIMWWSAAGIGSTPAHHASQIAINPLIDKRPDTHVPGPWVLALGGSLTADGADASSREVITPFAPNTFTFNIRITTTPNPSASSPTILPTVSAQMILVPLN